MWTLYVIFLILGFTSSIYMETCPSKERVSPCLCNVYENGNLSVTCYASSLDMETVRKALNSLSGKNDIHLYLNDLRNGTLPSNFFYGIGIKSIDFDHSDVDSLTDDNQPGLLGLENHVESLTIVGGFTEENAPAKLNLGHLKKLKKIVLESNAIMELGDDWFSNGPTSLEDLIIYNNGIKKIGNNAFAQLNNLVKLVLVGNQLSSIKRSMFPTSADRLVELILDNNGLTDIPEDIFYRMPSISKISLRDNAITTLDESTWSPIWQQLDDLNLDGNSIHCDNRLDWLLDYWINGHIPFWSKFDRCSAPEEFAGLSIDYFLEKRCQEKMPEECYP